MSYQDLYLMVSIYSSIVSTATFIGSFLYWTWRKRKWSKEVEELKAEVDLLKTKVYREHEEREDTKELNE